MRGPGGKSLSQADINKLIQAFMKKQKRVAGNKLRPANANLAAASLQNLIKNVTFNKIPYKIFLIENRITFFVSRLLN